MRTILPTFDLGKRRLIILVIGLFVLTSTQVAGQIGAGEIDDASVRSAVSDLGGRSEEKARAAIRTLHKSGKQAIPILIEHIDVETGGAFILKNPNSSFIVPRALENSLGKTSAYMVELILGREELVDLPDQKSPFMFGEASNYVYWDGVIVDSQNNALKLNELGRIKTLYENWWLSNKDSSLSSLRKEWSEGRKPLSGSGFRWK